MTRTPAIAWFERCYLAACAVRLGVSLANWQASDAGALQVTIAAALLLWFGVVYRRSTIAAVIACLFFLVSLVAMAITLPSVVAAGGRAAKFTAILAVTQVLNAAALVALAHAARDGWFRKSPDAAS